MWNTFKIAFISFIVVVLVTAATYFFIMYQRENTRSISIEQPQEEPRKERTPPAKITSLVSDACIVTVKDTCQPLAQIPGGNILAISQGVVDSQNIANSWILYSRMLGYQGSLFGYYKETVAQNYSFRRDGAPVNIYYDEIREIYEESLKNNLNPAYIYATYEHIYQLIAEYERTTGNQLSTNQSELIISPAQLTSEITRYSQNPAAIPPEVKAVSENIYLQATYESLITSLPSVLIDMVFNKENGITNEYQKIFMTMPSGDLNVQFSSQLSDHKEKHELILCQNRKAHYCQRTGNQLSCAPAEILNVACKYIADFDL